MWRQALNRRVWILGFCLTLVVPSPGALAQPKENSDKATQGMAAEGLAEEALRRIESADYQEAFVLSQRIKQMKPDLDRLLLIEGLLFISPNSRNYVAATQKFEAYNKTDTGKVDYRGFWNVGRIFRDSKLYGVATYPLEQAKKLAPPTAGGKPIRAEITLALAKVYLERKQIKKALDEAKQAEAMAPTEPDIQLELGKIALSNKDYETANTASEKAIGLLGTKIRSSPYDSAEVVRLQVCYKLRTSVAREQATLNPKNPTFLLDLSEAERRMGETERRMGLIRAREFALKGLGLDAKSPRPLLVLAEIEAELGAMQDAMDRVNEAINNDPQNEAAKRMKEILLARSKAPIGS